ncbi:unnamed protein product [Effrenium voratum]|nr:unnamed protein product [Effrenium voratum]
MPSVERFDDTDLSALSRRRPDGSDSVECSICLAHLLPSEEAVQLPCAARHTFHNDCVRPWLMQNVTRWRRHFGDPLAVELGGHQDSLTASIWCAGGMSPQKRFSFSLGGYTRDGGVILRYEPRPVSTVAHTSEAGAWSSEDAHRTGAYFNAITWNPASFKDKVVLDVGAGTCILSIFAAKAGAKEVFAVEATDMAIRGRKIVEAQGMGHIIKVLQGTVETVTLPSKVDVIISEWMGYLLLRESMLDSVLIARDRFLKPGGALFPSHATLYLAPVGAAKACREKQQSFDGERQHWEDFNGTMRKWYGTDFACMRDEFLEEQRKYYLQTGMFVNLSPKQLVGDGSPLLRLDLLTATLEDLKAAC